MERIANRFLLPKVKQNLVFEKTKTQQQFENESNINTIVAKSKKTGLLVDPLIQNRRQAIFGDFSAGSDFFEIQCKVKAAEEEFETLPAAIKKRFNHNPAELIDFMNDSANREEAEKLGLVAAATKPNTLPVGTDAGNPNTPPESVETPKT